MATPQRRTSIRKTLTVGAVAVAAALLGVTAPAASAAPVTPATSFTTLDTPAAWAAVHANADAGYPVSEKLAASCGAKQ